MILSKVKNLSTRESRRWLRRTNVYIAEYIIMLMLVGSLLSVLVSLWFSLFGMMQASSFIWSMTITSQLGALLIIAPSALWLFSRVTGQEMLQPELHSRTSRTVFLTIWLLGAAAAVVGLAIALTTATLSTILEYGDELGAMLMSMVLPGLLSIATILFGVAVVAKRASHTVTVRACLVLVALTVLLTIGNLTVLIVYKNQGAQQNIPSTGPLFEMDSEDCTVSRYINEKCSYSEYQRDTESRQRQSSDYRDD